MSKLVHKKDAILKAFKCQQSGNCCKCPGFVYVDEKTVQEMASILKIDVSEFVSNYVKIEKGWKVVATPTYRSNCFLDERNNCKVYEARPNACRTYPDWPGIWESDAKLLEETRLCPGLRLAVSQFS